MKKATVLEKIIKDYKEIDTCKDLQKRKLTPADHFALFEIIQELIHNKQSQFIQKSICDYLQKLGAKTTTKGICYIASV